MSAFFVHMDWPAVIQATWETLAMLAGSAILAVVLGLPLGVSLFVTAPGRMFAAPGLNGALSLAVNVLRSVPFIILLILMMPLTLIIAGTTLGVPGAIPPLVVGAAPFFARLVEAALREVDRGVIEAAQAMGATPRQIVLDTLLPEALPGILAGATVTTVALVSYTAMAGVVGAGGLGDLAVRFGYQRFQTDVMLVTVLMLLVLVQGLQWAGDRLVAHFGRR
jgi:D-methionine transport system permease protein